MTMMPLHQSCFKKLQWFSITNCLWLKVSMATTLSITCHRFNQPSWQHPWCCKHIAFSFHLQCWSFISEPVVHLRPFRINSNSNISYTFHYYRFPIGVGGAAHRDQKINQTEETDRNQNRIKRPQLMRFPRPVSSSAPNCSGIRRAAAASPESDGSADCSTGCRSLLWIPPVSPVAGGASSDPS